MSEEGITDNNNETMPRSVGEQLRSAREQHGMDRQDVADQLHLRPSIIQAIEESDYGVVPADLFLKGYVRSYARLTEQDGDDLIARLDRELEPYRQSQEEKEPSTTEIIHQTKLRRRRIGVALITTVTVLVLGWLVYQYGALVVNSAGDVVDTVGEMELDVPDSEPKPDVEPEPEPEPELEPDSDTGTGTGTDAGSQAQVTTAETESDLSTPVATVEESKTAEDESGQPMTSSAPGAGRQASLTIAFNGACWVEVVDGSGERVVVTLAEAGDRVDYEGPAPFEVLLGNVDAVAGVRFMGEAVDLGQYPVNAGRAQFVLETVNG
ncbi:RodZ domain-containing protein [Salicola sp. Rm-C-2C1-2]|uniref:RodZ domain-containing protein n=1 Tax=Salicola sp. Rm-C-2C1-2 TaxID=3141321 RepID=UPI0032E52C58